MFGPRWGGRECKACCFYVETLLKAVYALRVELHVIRDPWSS